jgi:hypothetical protein
MAELTLPPQTLEELRRAKREIEELKPFLRKAQIAGVDTARHDQDIAEVDQKVRRIRDGFFPGETL